MQILSDFPGAAVCLAEPEDEIVVACGQAKGVLQIPLRSMLPVETEYDRGKNLVGIFGVEGEHLHKRQPIPVPGADREYEVGLVGHRGCKRGNRQSDG